LHLVMIALIAANVRGLAFGGVIINVQPGPLPIYLLMLNYDS
jgi:hypothetical protein